MKKFFKTLLDLIEVHINAVIFLTMFLSMLGEVFMRYVLNRPSPVLHEITMYSFVWTVYLSASLAHRFDRHIRFNIIYDMFPRKVKVAIDMSFNIFMSVLFSISFYPVVRELINYNFIKSTVLGISWTYLYMVFPIFIVLVLIHNAVAIYREIRELFFGETPPKEEEIWD